jgi:hypothetical protein
MACKNCLFFIVDGNGCKKVSLLAEFQGRMFEKKKAMLFLNYQVSRLDKVHCREKFDEQEEEKFKAQNGAAFEEYKKFLERQLSWVDLQPWSILRRNWRQILFNTTRRLKPSNLWNS